MKTPKAPEPKDMFKQELKVNDIVQINPPNTKGMCIGRVVKLFPKSQDVQILFPNPEKFPYSVNRASRLLIQINEKYEKHPEYFI